MKGERQTDRGIKKRYSLGKLNQGGKRESP